jgi:Caspase domain
MGESVVPFRPSGLYSLPLANKRARSLGDSALIAIGISDYNDWDALPGVRRDLQDVTRELGRFFAAKVPEFKHGGTLPEVADALSSSMAHVGTESVRRLILFWTGHGAREGDGFYLIARDSPKAKLQGFNSIPADTVGSLIAKSGIEKILVVLDTCHSGAAASAIAKRFATVVENQTYPPDVEPPAVAIIASALPLQRARDGAFVRALVRVLRDGAPGGEPLWTDHDRWISLEELTDVIDQLLAEEVSHRPSFAQFGRLVGFLPNPRFQEGLASEDVETLSRRRRARDYEQEFERAARGIEMRESGWYFSGRVQLLRDVVTWMKDAPRGMFVVTGKPGSGKSAILGRIATLQLAEFRHSSEFQEIQANLEAATLPPESSVDAAVYARGLTLEGCTTALADQLGLAISLGAGTAQAQLAAHLRDAHHRFTLILDALDESAEPPAIADQLLRPLAALPNTRLLVGTRKTSSGASILSMLDAEHTTIRDLDDEHSSEDDIAAYVVLRLLDARRDSPYRGDEDAARAVASEVAREADGVFLFARIISGILRNRPEPLDLASQEADVLLHGGLKGVFEQNLARYGAQEPRVRELLQPLAWAEGAGLPRHNGIWATLAEVLAPNGVDYSDVDVAWVLREAGDLIVEAAEGGQTVYRLYHEFLAEYFRAALVNAIR